MKEYMGYLVPLSEASRAWNEKWYAADDVADLARRGRKYMTFMYELLVAKHMLSAREQERIGAYMTELEQIAGEKKK